MATTEEYAQFLADQIDPTYAVRYRKMFGEYMVYVNDKPILLLCDNTVYVKKLDSLTELMEDVETGTPYDGAKEHYILDIDDTALTNQVIEIVEEVTPIPKPRKKKKSE